MTSLLAVVCGVQAVFVHHAVVFFSPSSLRYRVQVVFEFACHARDEVDVVVHTAAYTAVHQGAYRWLLSPRVEQVLSLGIAVHGTPAKTILKRVKSLLAYTKQPTGFHTPGSYYHFMSSVC